MLKKHIILTALFLAASLGCMSEVKPVLQPAPLDINARIANHQRWIDQGIASRELTGDAVKAIQAELNRIREEYERLQARGTPTPKEVEKIKRMLDENSDMIFREKQKSRKSLPSLRENLTRSGGSFKIAFCLPASLLSL